MAKTVSKKESMEQMSKRHAEETLGRITSENRRRREKKELPKGAKSVHEVKTRYHHNTSVGKGRSK
jgi:hypothetical protein